MEGRLVVIEGKMRTRMESYWELLDYAIKQTYEICVNSPEEYDDLTEEEREKLDKVHDLWM